MELNKIYNQDCIEYMKTLPNECIDLIIEDRPYGKLPKNKVYWDNSYKIEGIFKEYYRILKPNGQLLIWGQQPFLSFVLIEALENKFEYRFEQIWEKPSSTWSSDFTPLKVHEQFLVFKKINIKTTDCIFNIEDIKTKGEPYSKDSSKWNEHNSVQNIKRVNTIIKNEDGMRYPRTIIKAPSKPYMKKEERTLHPTQKSLLIADWQIKAFTNENNLIYIPFGGSGTEIIACIKNNRNYLATELDKNYIENIINIRIDNLEK